MSELSDEDHYECAARRHYADAVYLLDGSRFPNADYHLGFSVECALKSLLLRYLGATMAPVKQGKPAPKKPWVAGTDGKPQYLGHLPALWSDVELHLNGRSGGRLVAVLQKDTFRDWSVDHRYRDGRDVVEATVYQRRTVAGQILELHARALIDGVIT